MNENEKESNIDATISQAQASAEEKVKVKNRFEELSTKVILEAKAKEAEAEARKKAEAERDSFAKERDFYKDFSSNVAKYPNAAQFQDKILEKVRSGYSTEDAMISVLVREGKLESSSSTSQSQMQVEGGSSATSFSGTKSIGDMTPAEKLAALTELDRDGTLANVLRGRL